jgi:D-inositol-3-phosphate glycosyltransferase
MRICVISYHSSPLEPIGEGKSGGMNIVISNLYSRMALFADVDIFVCGPKRIVQNSPGVRIIQIPRSDIAAFVESILSENAERSYDLIHTHYWLSGVVGLELHRSISAPWLHTLHTVEALKTIRQDTSRIEVEEKIIRTCDLVVSPTRQEAFAIKTLYPDARVITIPHGVDTSRFIPSQNGHNNILFVGRVDPIKGIHLLVDALRLVKQDFNLTVVGGPSKGERNFDDIKTYAAGLPVDFTGPVRHEKLGEYYRKAALLVVPSYYESFGLVGLEAMASARPVVGFEHTGLQETVGDDAGILVKMGARNLAGALSKLLEDKNLRHRLGEQGRSRVIGFDWSNIVREYRRLYERIIKE